MSGPFGSSQWMYASGAEAESQSLRFNDDDSAYLSWTPASAGNRKTWTWSAWVKRGNLGQLSTFFFAANGSAYDLLSFTSSDQLYYLQWTGSAYIGRKITNAVFRDTSAWYHIVVAIDGANATVDNRIKIYVNGTEQTSFSSSNNHNGSDGSINTTNTHYIGQQTGTYFDGYLSEVNFVDGLALDPTSFGETDANGQWVPIIEPSVTYGTNGFYLPFTNDYEVEGFNTVLWRGNGVSQYVGGVGFQPDFVWVKERSSTSYHNVYDSVRGATNYLLTSQTDAEATASSTLTSFDSDGFSVGNAGGINESSQTYVAWTWDMGTGSAVSNTDGSITSSVKASQTYGQSIVSYTGNGTAGATVGHGLSSAPEMVIVKARNFADGWAVYHKDTTANEYLLLNTTDADFANSTFFNNTAPDSSVVTLGNNNKTNSTYNYIAYCFHSVAGYSDFGSYTGTGVAGNTVTTGFRPAFVMIKKTSSFGNWYIYDNVRGDNRLQADQSDADYLQENVDFLDDGFELTSTASGFNANGSTYIYMAFADKREAAFWLDQSGNNNDWTNNNMQESDISLDSPTNNFAVLNPLDTDGTLSEGNLEVFTGSSDYGATRSNFAVSSGKYYWEVLCVSSSSNNQVSVWVEDINQPRAIYGGFNSRSWSYYGGNGQIFNNNSGSSYGATFGNGDIIGVALDMDAGEVTFYKNNVSQGVAATGITGDICPGISDGSVSVTTTSVANFGQDSSFAGNKVAQGNQDANGKGDFYYEPPSGYLALCTDNLPDPAIADPSEHFNTVLWTGTGGSRSITGVGFQPDFVWTKNRSQGYFHILYDAVRGSGVNKELSSNVTSAEGGSSTNLYGFLSSFGEDGFDTSGGTDGSVPYAYFNQSSDAYVAWNWKADNTSGASNTDGTITSTVSANTTAGFSIVSYTGTGANATVGHGLSSAPDMIIVKDRDVVRDWVVYHSANTSAPETDYLRLSDTDATADLATAWNDTAPTSNVFSIGTSSGVNLSGSDFIAYCFHSVEGYSKFGSYTGNGSSDGPFVYTGFRPAFVLYKGSDEAGSWVIWDTSRNTHNVVDKYLLANDAVAEGTATALDILSNGFKLRTSSGSNNTSGKTYIYMAFAENPFKYSNAR